MHAAEAAVIVLRLRACLGGQRVPSGSAGVSAAQANEATLGDDDDDEGGPALCERPAARRLTKAAAQCGSLGRPIAAVCVCLCLCDVQANGSQAYTRSAASG